MEDRPTPVWLKKRLLSSSSSKQWSQLPDDLLDSITNLLNLDDLIRFSIVCKTWNSASSSLLPPKLNTPFLITPHEVLKPSSPSETDQDYPTWNKTLGVFSLYNGEVYNIDVPQVINRQICGSCNGGWLITVQGNSAIQVLHPFSKVVIHLPPIIKKGKKHLYTPENVHVYKFVMSCSDVKKGIVMVIQGFLKSLAFFRIGKDKKWIIVDGDDNAGLLDVTFYEGKFYAVGNLGHVFVVEGLESICPTVKSFISPPSRLGSGKYYLVESLGKLLLVARSMYDPEVDDDLSEEDNDPRTYQTTSFTVYRLAFNGPKWVKVSTIGKNRSLFVGFNQSFSLKTSDFPGCKGNCIYFTDDNAYYCYSCKEQIGGHDIGVYNLALSCVQKCYPSDALMIKPAPIWFTTHSY